MIEDSGCAVTSKVKLASACLVLMRCLPNNYRRQIMERSAGQDPGRVGRIITLAIGNCLDFVIITHHNTKNNLLGLHSGTVE